MHRPRLVVPVPGSGATSFPSGGDRVCPNPREWGASGCFIPCTKKQCKGGTNTPTHKPRGSGSGGAELSPARSREVSAAPLHPVPMGEEEQRIPRVSPDCPGAARGGPHRPASASPLPHSQPLGRFYSSRYQMSIIGSEKQQTL